MMRAIQAEIAEFGYADVWERRHAHHDERCGCRHGLDCMTYEPGWNTPASAVRRTSRLLRFWIVEGVLIMDPMSAVAPYNHEGVPDPARAALLVIDMQEHFADIATAIVPAVSSLVTAARKADMPVFYTRHGHHDLSVDGGVLATWWSNDLSMVGDASWPLLSRITPRPYEPIIDKSRYSAFFDTQLESLLSARDVSNLVICGVVTNCCIETTARDGFMRDYNVFVASDASAATNEDLHISSLKGMAYSCARVLPSAQVCDALERQSPSRRRFLEAGP